MIFYNVSYNVSVTVCCGRKVWTRFRHTPSTIAWTKYWRSEQTATLQSCGRPAKCYRNRCKMFAALRESLSGWNCRLQSLLYVECFLFFHMWRYSWSINTLSHSPNIWSPSEVCPKFSCQIWVQPAGANNIKQQQLVPSLVLKVMQKALKDDE